MAQSESERSFGEVALDLGLVTQAQIDEVIDAAEKLEQIGLPERIGNIFVKKSYMTDQQVQDVLREQARSRKHSIPGYTLIEKIGQGSMGAVYKAKQESMDRIVAMKILSPSLAKNKSFTERFIREARSVARLSHPNVIQGIDVGYSGKFYYFVMEYIDGPTVAQLLRREGPLPEERALTIIRQVARALDHAARNGIVHRDIKPDNIMIDRRRDAKLCDLGLAKAAEAGGGGGAGAGGAVGTPHYISPEQAQGRQDVDIRSDIYSLGATFYHLVTGSTPFKASTPEAVMSKHLNDQAPHPRTVREELSDGTCEVISKMMARSRSDRYPTPALLLKDVDSVIDHKSPKARLFDIRKSVIGALPAEFVARKRTHPGQVQKAVEDAARRRRVMLVGAAMLSVVVLVGVIVLTGGRAPKTTDEGVTPTGAEATGGPGSAVSEENKTGLARVQAETLARSRRQLEEARTFASENPKKYPEVISRFRVVIAACSGEVRDQARAEMEKWTKLLQQERQRLLDETKKRAKELMADNKFREAYWEFSKLAKHQFAAGDAAFADRLKKERGRIWKTVQKYVEGLAAKASGAIEAKDFKAAEAIAAQIASVGFKSLAAPAEEIRKKIEKAKQEIAAAEAREAELAKARAAEQFDKLVQNVYRLLSRWNYADAVAACARAANDRNMRDKRDEINLMKRDILLMEKTHGAAFSQLAAKVGSGERVAGIGKQGIGGKVVAADEQYVEIGSGKGNALISFSIRKSDLTIDNIVQWAPIDLATAQGRYEKALFLLYHGKGDEALSLLRSAANATKPVEDAKYHLEKIEQKQKQAREERAAEVLARARDAFARKDREALSAALEEFDGLKDTEVYRSNYESTVKVKRAPGTACLVLCGFETDRDFRPWRKWPQTVSMERVSEHVTSGRFACKLGYSVDQSTSISRNLSGKMRDWSAFSHLKVDIFLDSQSPRTLNFSVFDGQCTAGDWKTSAYFGSSRLKPGENRIEVPLRGVKTRDKGRAIDFRDVRLLAVSTSKSRSAGSIVLDDLRVE